ncbi:MAG: HlyD family efflux transporter periplasmic adaptor subunit, partial [Deltaproteobacteria bacterium]|nr:HlyD family efflux transporter periplasmic adaptor subunit [Deltaproteobacteria bacterium]
RVKMQGAEVEIAAAQAMLLRAATLVAECRLAAPHDGYVQTRAYEVGEVVMPGSRILTLVDIGEVKAIFYLPNAELDAAQPGRPVTVVADAMPERSFAGAVRRVGVSAEFTPRNVQTRADRDRLVYAVEVAIPNAEGLLRPGMPVEIVVPGTARELRASR